jgi:hypothetical protein
MQPPCSFSKIGSFQTRTAAANAPSCFRDRHPLIIFFFLYLPADDCERPRPRRPSTPSHAAVVDGLIYFNSTFVTPLLIIICSLRTFPLGRGFRLSRSMFYVPLRNGNGVATAFISTAGTARAGERALTRHPPPDRPHHQIQVEQKR